MSDGLKPNLMCPECGKHVLGVFHDWRMSENTATFEYHHHEDVERDRQGLEPHPCTVVLPYDEGFARMKAESQPVGE